MAFCIGADEDPAVAVRRVLREQNRKALSLLEGWEESPASAIHRTRQTFKRIRALLRLLRPGARYVYAVENGFYADLQRRIAWARDAQSMVEALDRLVESIDEPLVRQSISMLRFSLAQRAPAAAALPPELVTEIETALDSLRSADSRFRHLRLRKLHRRHLYRGLGRTLGLCQRYFESVRESDDLEQFHEWRKQVKYLGHQARLMKEFAPEWCEEVRPQLAELAAVLGETQDLALLGSMLREQPDALGVDTHLLRLRRSIDTSRQSLQAQARMLGHDLFGPGGPDTSRYPELDRAIGD